MTNKLYFGDNLDVLREHVKDESVDLVYLDPPFNSNATYNVLFKERSVPSAAQAEAFRDTWGWGEAAAIAYDETLRRGGDTALLLRAFRSWLGDNAMMAYLVMMSIRLIELRRVLKPTGSIYLHCDPTASHYLKLVLDSIFGRASFINEAIWKRTTTKSDFFQGAKNWPRIHDTILYYARDIEKLATFVQPFTEYDASYIAAKYGKMDEDGRRYMLDNLTAPGAGSRGHPKYEFMGVTRYWRYNYEKMERLREEGRVIQPSHGAVPRYKRYLDEMRGIAVGDVWTDIDAINSQAVERLGYPTQKPLVLLERIISASSNPGDVILDPFCGCGTSIEAAERLGRQWAGIDVTHYAVTLIEKRLARYSKADYNVQGRPTDLAGARDLARRDKYQFQWWAAWLLGAQTYESRRGADRGIDANIYFANGPYGHGRIIVSVKGGDNISPAMVRELSGVVQREENATMGILVTLAEPTKAMLADAAGAGFVEKSAHGRLPRIQVATVEDMLDGRFPKLPPLPQPVNVTPRRKGAKDRDQLELLLPISSGGIVTEEGATVDPRYLRIA